MAVFSIKSFGGIAPIVPARYLQDNQAQTAMNCPVFQGSIQSLSALGASVASLPKTGTVDSAWALYAFLRARVKGTCTTMPPRELQVALASPRRGGQEGPK